MRLLVDTAAHASASASLVGGNHVAALAHGALTTALAGSGALAGSDATAASFAPGYDAAARDAVGGLGDLVDAFGTLARITGTAHDSWVRAESRSADEVHDDGDPLAPGPVTVRAVVPPGSLGGDAVDLPPFWNALVDHLQGFTWPDADVARLRSTGRAWRSAAVDVDLLTTYCDDAGHRIADLRAPEVPLARQAFRRLRGGATELACEYRAIATACDGYADAVETHRATVRGIVRELVVEAGISAGLGVLLGLASAGVGAGLGATAAGTRLAAAARRIVEVLRGLRDLCRLRTAVALEGVTARLAPIRALLARLADAGLVRVGLWTPARAVDDVMRSLAKGSSSKVKVVDSERDLNRVWHELTRGASKGPPSPRGSQEPWYNRPDGIRLRWRMHSGSGGPTIDIDYPDRAPRKIHIHVPR